MVDREVMIIDGVRTPFGKYGGALRTLSSIELGALVMREVLQRTEVPGDQVQEIFYGTCMAAEVALNQNIPARQAMLKAGLPPTTLSLTVDRACCSSTTAIQLGFQAVRTGMADTVLAVGAENVSNIPLMVEGSRWGHRPGGLQVLDPLYNLGYPKFTPVALDAGEVAVEHQVGRDLQDTWALRSQQRYEQARLAGKFSEEMMTVRTTGQKGTVELVADDEFPKPNTTLDQLSRLPTVNGSPTVTPGNAPGFDAGAAALLLMASDYCAQLAVQPLARIVCAVSVAIEHRRFAEAPAFAIQKALRTADLSLDQLDLIEINEAFAAVPLVSTKLLANEDHQRWQVLQEKTNVNGGAVAVGHPVGATGARLVLTLCKELRRRGARYGVAAICGGLGQADAVIVEALKS